METEIVDGLASYRYAKHKPRWASYEQRTKGGGKRGSGTYRFVWNEEETRCYLLMWGRPPFQEKSSWRVHTFLTPRR